MLFTFWPTTLVGTRSHGTIQASLLQTWKGLLWTGSSSTSPTSAQSAHQVELPCSVASTHGGLACSVEQLVTSLSHLILPIKSFLMLLHIFNRKVPPNRPGSQNTFASSNTTRRGLCNTYGKRRGPSKAFLFLHHVGKWHLGFCNASYLPTNRGFQSFFGQLSQVLDFFGQ